MTSLFGAAIARRRFPRTSAAALAASALPSAESPFPLRLDLVEFG
jgi:hypothetical protein